MSVKVKVYIQIFLISLFGFLLIREGIRYYDLGRFGEFTTISWYSFGFVCAVFNLSMIAESVKKGKS